jgi:hypothetical protein
MLVFFQVAKQKKERKIEDLDGMVEMGSSAA